MLGFCIVDRDDRVFQDAIVCHASEADDACRGFLCPAYDTVDQFSSFRVERGNKVSSVIQGNLRLCVKDRIDMLIVGLVVLPVDGKNRYIVMLHERCGNIILRAQGI